MWIVREALLLSLPKELFTILVFYLLENAKHFECFLYVYCVNVRNPARIPCAPVHLGEALKGFSHSHENLADVFVAGGARKREKLCFSLSVFPKEVGISAQWSGLIITSIYLFASTREKLCFSLPVFPKEVGLFSSGQEC